MAAAQVTVAHTRLSKARWLPMGRVAVSVGEPRGPLSVLAVIVAVSAISPPLAAADDVSVPPRVQAQLLAAVTSFQTNLKFSIDGAVQILVLTNDKDPQSDRVARQLVAALGEMRKIMRRPHRESIEPFRGGPALAAACRERGISVVYLAPGLGGAISEIDQALRGSAVLTAGAVASYVPRGVLLGFDLVSGRAEMLFSPIQMRALDVHFPASIFQLMRIVE